MDFLHNLVCAAIAWLVLCKSARCQEECSFSLNITPGHHYQIKNPSFPYLYTPGSDCTWEVTTRLGHRVKLTCDKMWMPAPDGSCEDYLAVTTEGDLEDGTPYCAPFTATGSSLKIQLVSLSSFGGKFLCDVTSEEIPEAGPNQTENCECGWSQSTRIVSGTDAEGDEFPSMASVIQYINETHNYLCGGTIIGRRVVLTAAHCVDPEPRNNGIIVGEHVITNSDIYNRRKHLKISRVIIHPNALESEGHHDIALLVTAADLEYSSSVSPACLPFNITKEDLIGKYVTITGWGKLQQNGSRPETLQKVGLPIVPDSECSSIYSETLFIPQYHLCTSGSGKGHCYGDSGGPLYYYNHQKSCHIVVGVVCHGDSCNGTVPSVNVDVHYHLPWIQDELPDVKFCKK